MNLGSILLMIGISFLIGAIARSLLGYRWQGCFFLTFCGFLGMLVGRFVFIEKLDWSIGSWSYFTVGNQTVPWFWGLVSAMVIIVILHRIGGRR